MGLNRHSVGAIHFIFILLSISTILQAAFLEFASIVPLVKGQSQEPLPVLLIHGYRSSDKVWNEWVDQFETHGIEAKAVRFRDNPTTVANEDECGSAQDHAAQLNQWVNDFKEETEAEKVNIVTHSKGGLDARLYLANNPSSSDVANLIMIGTPNEGSPLADRYHVRDNCKPAVGDLRTDSPVLGVPKNEHTRYHTIASNWISAYKFIPILPFWWIAEDTNCPFPSNWFDLEGWNFLTFQYNGRNEITGPDDGIVPVWSVEEAGESQSLGRTDNCHTNMFTNEEFDKVMNVLLN